MLWSLLKILVFVALVAFAAARPDKLDDLEHTHHEHEHVELLVEESDPIDGANFRNLFELDNGIKQSMVGSADESGAQVMSGSYTFPLPDGTIATFDWVADAAGFRIVNESPLLPVAPVNPHPVPAHAQEQIDFANAQQAAGLAWDQTAEAWI